MISQMKALTEIESDYNRLKKAYNDLLVKEERYRLLTEHARDVIWTMKLDGTITYISPAVEELRGITVEEAMSQTVDQILTPESAAPVIGYIQELIADHAAGLSLKCFRGELDYYRSDGSIMHTEVIVYPINGGELHAVTILGVTRDITERKQLQEKLIYQTQSLKELNATKDKFFSIIAHDLRSPFFGILALSEMLRDEARELGLDSMNEYAELIHTSAKQAYDLLENLLNWAKTQQGAFPYAPTKLSLSNLVAREMDQMKMVADQKHVKLDYTHNGEVTVHADTKMLETIIRNLISNAIKFTHANGVVGVSLRSVPESAEITISDTGIGMDEGTVRSLFTVDKGPSISGTQNERGSGLGLIICKEFVERHGGTIQVQSELGKGSQFRVSLPLRLTPAETQTATH